MKDALWQYDHGLKKNFQTQNIAEKIEFVRTKSKDNVGTVSTAGWHPDRPERVDAFCGLVATLYSLKTKKIPAERVALDDWLGCYKVSTKVDIFA